MKRHRINKLGWLLSILLWLIGLFLLTFAIPVPVWRSGELPFPPLPVIEHGPVVAMPKRVWIDTDAACGYSTTTDPDDCFALLLLSRSAELKIGGISTVFGNAPVEISDRTVRELKARLLEQGVDIGPVHRGRGRRQALSVNTAPALTALRSALQQGPLTLIALGPLTNIAAALADRPELQRRVSRLIVVMGRTPGHLFHPSEGSGGGMLFGHGPVFRDFNFDQDRMAAANVLAMKLPLTLVPYIAARQVQLDSADLTLLGNESDAGAWIASRAQGWLNFWREAIGRDGFYPFDLLAAVYALRPELLSCARVTMKVAKDERLWGGFYAPEALLVATQGERHKSSGVQASALFCADIDSRLKRWAVRRMADIGRHN